MRKDILLESINRQRKLMGLNELFDANIDAKGALSGNKLDLGIVPLEEMDPDDDLADDPDAQEMADSDEIDLSDVDSSDDVNRHPDEDDFYRQQPGEDLSDTMDSRYPDPNERDWQMNRYSGLDEGFFDSIKAGAGAIGSMPTVFKYKKSKLGWDKEMKNIKKYLDGIKNTLNSANASLAKANQVFPQIKQLGSSIAGFNSVEKEHNDINKMIQTLNTSINSAEQTLDADEKADDQTSTSVANQMTKQAQQLSNNPQAMMQMYQMVTQMMQMASSAQEKQALKNTIQVIVGNQNKLNGKKGGNGNKPNNKQTNNKQTAPAAPAATAPAATTPAAPAATTPAAPAATAPAAPAPAATAPAAGQNTNNGFAPPTDTNNITNEPNKYYDENEPPTGQNKGDTNISEKKKKK